MKNFAKQGAIVGQVPSGTGSLVLVTENVYFHDNTITNNKTTSIAIASYELIYELGKRNQNQPEEEPDVVGSACVINDKYTNDTNYNPYPKEIKIGKNSFKTLIYSQPLITILVKILLFKKPFQTVDVLWDGLVDSNAAYTICFEAGTETLPFMA